MKNNIKISLSLLALAIVLLFIPIQQAKSDYTEQKLNNHVSILVMEKTSTTTTFDLFIDGSLYSIIKTKCSKDVFWYLPINGLPDGEVYKPFYVKFNDAGHDELLALNYVCRIK